ncbi:MAG: YIP1 family protein [Thalassovita sp.]|uniref:YIP1 family protein n=1 Tax=Thalassovita litoralis TaxID=1010611 RepID=UPI00163DE105|nr:YIP1 family protein [Thalassovita litoralis]
MNVNLKDLALETLTAPRVAAARILDLRLGMDVIWTLLALVAVVNTIFYSLSITQFEVVSGIATGMNLPLLYLGMLAGSMVLGALVLRWVGQMFGGRASFPDLMVLVIWLQALRAAAQALLLLVMMVSPGLANLAAIGLGLFGLWLLANFLDVAQGWNSLGKSFAVLVITGLGFVFGLSLFMLLIGASAMGV